MFFFQGGYMTNRVVDFTIFSDSINYTGAVSNPVDVLHIDISDTVQLEQMISLCIHTPYQFNGKRAAANFTHTDLIFQDFDEDSIESFVKSPLSKYHHLIYCSKSHQRFKNGTKSDRFHVLYLLSSQCNDKPKLEKMLDNLKTLGMSYGLKPDKCDDLARLIFPSRDSGDVESNPFLKDTLKYNQGEDYIDNVVDSLMKEFETTNFINNVKTAVVPIHIKIDFELTQYNLEGAMEYFRSLPKGSLNHNERFAICCGLYNELGDSAKELYLSIGSEPGDLRNWESAKTGRYNEVTLGSILHIAAAKGFKVMTKVDVADKKLRDVKERFQKFNEQHQKNRKELEQKVTTKVDVLKQQVQTIKTMKINNINSNLELKKIELESEGRTEEYKLQELASQKQINDITEEEANKLIMIGGINTDNIKNSTEIAIKLNAPDLKSTLDSISNLDKVKAKEEEAHKKEQDKIVKEAKKAYKDSSKMETQTNAFTDTSDNDLRRRFPELKDIWEMANEDHSECKVFLRPLGKGTKLVKVDGRGETGDIFHAHESPWSGQFEAPSIFDFIHTTGFFNTIGEPINELCETDARDIVLNDPYNRNDDYYKRGTIKIHTLPNTMISVRDNEGFELVMNMVYGDHTDFLLKFLVMVALEHRVQARPIVAFTGERGSGKTMYISLLEYLYPKSTSSFTLERFNSFSLSKVVKIEEVYNDQKAIYDLLKKLTGSTTIDVELKGQTQFSAPSISFFVLTSNERPLTITEMPNAADNQIFACRLNTSISNNKSIENYLKLHSPNLNVFDFLTARMGNWLQTKGMEIWEALLKLRSEKNLRYGVEVPITSELKSWFQVSFGEKDERMAEIYLDYVSTTSSTEYEALKLGYFVFESYVKNIDNELPMRPSSFVKTLGKRNIIDHKKTVWVYNDVTHYVHKITNLPVFFQLMDSATNFNHLKNGVFASICKHHNISLYKDLEVAINNEPTKQFFKNDQIEYIANKEAVAKRIQTLREQNNNKSVPVVEQTTNPEPIVPLTSEPLTKEETSKNTISQFIKDEKKHFDNVLIPEIKEEYFPIDSTRVLQYETEPKPVYKMPSRCDVIDKQNIPQVKTYIEFMVVHVKDKKIKKRRRFSNDRNCCMVPTSHRGNQENLVIKKCSSVSTFLKMVNKKEEVKKEEGVLVNMWSRPFQIGSNELNFDYQSSQDGPKIANLLTKFDETTLLKMIAPESNLPHMMELDEKYLLTNNTQNKFIDSIRNKFLENNPET